MTGDIKTPNDVLTFMKKNIRYGWVDCDGIQHIDEMKDFRKKYRTSSIEDCLTYGIGTCIEQVALMHQLFEQIQIPSKMFCCRIFEPDDYANLEEDEHMHCFLLYYDKNHVYHMEYPNLKETGIYEYESEGQAIQTIQLYYIKLRGGKPSPVTEFYQVKAGLSFREFNQYINSLTC